MKRYRGLICLVIFLALCVGAVVLTLRATAEYPTLGEAVDYPVNQLEGFELSIEEPMWSPFKGYTLLYEIKADSETIYHLSDESAPFEYLEALVDGQWYRLERPWESINPITFDLGGSNTGLSGSLVQKYSNYGTRLEPGTYRLTMELTDRQGAPNYLAAEFHIA